MSNSLVTRTRRLAVPLLVAGFLLGGCSTGDGDDRSGGPPADGSGVASLRSPAATTGAPTRSVEDQRPLIRLDATTDEIEALRKVWSECVAREGGPGYPDGRSVIWRESQHDPKAKLVRAACRAQEPEFFEERQKRTDNATFRDNQRQWYECAKKAGYRLTTPDEDGEFGITEVGPNGDFQSPKMTACRREAFSR
ncbi:hypothetical protein [Micromonospora sp. WMMD714]|uniref:hypothetical protein n=1 Tax=Micromonospora sp. WMMD714 TaxID=3016097 RepID=UPI00249CB285|nr:hypothetical protein [Micromonospora sp. WMMD714]WFE63687.1 hypothetical protein O7625_10495 [Micromonospora sp. WMMD714]